jgi:hypothetical protein
MEGSYNTAEGAVPSSAVRDLMRAVLEALGIPHPATVGDREAHDRILSERAMHAAIALRSTLDGCPLEIEWTTGYLRERLAEHPVTGYGR